MMLRAIALVAVAVSVSACGVGPTQGRTYGAAHAFVNPAAELRHADAVIKAAEGRAGMPVAWRSERGAAGTATPVGDSFTDSSGRMCRVVRQETIVDAIPSRRDAVACREADGAWVVTD